MKKNDTKRSKYKIFSFKDNVYQIDFQLLVMNSQFFSRELEKYEFIQYINIVDDFDMILFISSDIVETFISFIHNHDIQLTLNNALALYSLSIKYEVTNLVDQSQQYISSHHVELIEQFLSTQNPNEI